MKQDNNSYFGFSASSEFLHFDWDEFVNYAAGRCILAIGQGKFQDTFSMSLRQAAAWGLYHNKPANTARTRQGRA